VLIALWRSYGRPSLEVRVPNGRPRKGMPSNALVHFVLYGTVNWEAKGVGSELLGASFKVSEHRLPDLAIQLSYSIQSCRGKLAYLIVEV
jgi:hypothetical protein